MLARCNNPKCPAWKYYGGADVTVDPSWDPAQGGSFENFYADNGPRPEGMSLGRLLDLHRYGPGRCRWMTPAEQGAERRKKKALKRRILARGLWQLRRCA